ncbi:MAG TPA: thiamine diphosphokinase [Capsulimonadaceae bacterium]|jgi:thiamine pyrophosphokinase
MRALIVANGTLPSYDRLRSAISDAEYVVAVDGGANGLHSLGLTAHAVLGDFDSVIPGSLPAVPRISAADQDYTDLDKAVQILIDKGASTITMTGVTGDRLDHTFGALCVLAKYGRRIPITLLDEVATGRLVVKNFIMKATIGQTISLLPLGIVQGVTTTGLRWPLHDDLLALGRRDGLSNRASSETVTVTAKDGNLVIYAHHPVDS